MIMLIKSAVAACLATTALAETQLGFCYGSQNEDWSCRGYEDFKRYFENAKTLASAEGKQFTSARLYTSIQCGTTNDPISAYKAAIDTDTKILVGRWASACDESYSHELESLLSASFQYGKAFTDLVVGISVGSEDLYRKTSAGNEQGATAGDIVKYIGELRYVIHNEINALENIPVGHVDTYTAWIRPENALVVDAVDWLGHKSFPYWESNESNAIENAPNLFWSALEKTRSSARGKDVWVTETGWPHAGPLSGAAVASVENAHLYWSNVGCALFEQEVNVWWYILVDSNANQREVEFGLTKTGDVSKPVFDLKCNETRRV
ncbi:GPI-anchored cell wall beta-1,3-endoglucanase EglC [Colletotrichum orchidophilum]|uniref:glucan endo-1,3-beta-D-glucosidase n=1 Tax=Colletotrichum orchidophilum TaxID=1209926 RepID=A0A1G4BKG5_9PEZI|nr:GPI-anchored cell wall beta-1,3-endoglucanase EglC [Colletotrichum orchidophilum]OHF01788.1 GPI-anchored cell wall beta-1,3-endoglucanase EglC [Colletotrichum orchidophilum]